MSRGRGLDHKGGEAREGPCVRGTAVAVVGYALLPCDFAKCFVELWCIMCAFYVQVKHVGEFCETGFVSVW